MTRLSLGDLAIIGAVAFVAIMLGVGFAIGWLVFGT